MWTVFKTRCWLSLPLCWKNYCQHALFLRETQGKLVPSPVIKIRRERKGKKLNCILKLTLLWHRQCQRKTLEIVNIVAKKNKTKCVIPVRSWPGTWEKGLLHAEPSISFFFSFSFLSLVSFRVHAFLYVCAYALIFISFVYVPQHVCGDERTVLPSHLVCLPSLIFTLFMPG